VKIQTTIQPLEVKKQSAALGETDVLKMLNYQPGISFQNDGSSYFYVRGGNKDQNLILLDEATIFSPSHLMGLFTPIIPDAVKYTNVYKADFPIQYGGRLSSVVDIRTRDGNMEKFSGTASIGLIANRITLEGPLFKKHNSSYFISLRRSHFGLFFKKAQPSLQDFYFSDLATKFNFRLTDKDRLFLTFYAGKDIFLNGEDESVKGLEWGNNALTLRWNHIYGNRMFSNTTFYTSNYDYYLHTDYHKKINWNSHISNASMKTEFTYFYNPKNKIKYGINLGLYFFNPGNYNAPGIAENHTVSTVNSGEVTLYAGNEHNIVNFLKLNYGIRFNGWNNYGEAFVVKYDDANNPQVIREYAEGEKFYNSNNIEPRISISFRTDEYASVKLSYNKTIQHINQINNSISPFNTLEVWLPSGPNIKPQLGHIFNAEYVKTWPKKSIDLNTGIYYKIMKNQIGYAYHAEMLLNPYIESAILQGRGNAYGFELSLKKLTGKLTGQLAYAYTRSLLNIPELNEGREFPSHQDKPIDLSLMLEYHANNKLMVTTNMVYTSGMRITTPTSFYGYRGGQVPYYSKQNNSRLPDYKRIDVGATFYLKKMNNIFNHTLNLSFYNFFSMINPAFVYFNKIEVDDEYLVPADKQSPQYLETTGRFVYFVIPSLTYNLSF